MLACHGAICSTQLRFSSVARAKQCGRATEQHTRHGRSGRCPRTSMQMFCCEHREEMSNEERRLLILLQCLDDCCCWGTVELMLDVELKSKVDGSVNEDRIPASASKKMNKSPCSARCWPSCHAAGKRLLLHGIFSSVLSNPPGYITRLPCPRVRPRGHTTQRARREIFKLSLS